jgi:hypothetical protein
MKASIVVLGYNGEKYLRDALESLLNLDFPKRDYEIIYVDNNSTDNSCKIVEEYEKKYKNVRVIRNESNLGFAAGNNVGIRAANGEYIALFNQDAIADKNWLGELVNLMEKNSKIGAACGKIYYKDSYDLYFGGGRIFYGGFCWNWSLNDKEGECDYVSGCAMLIRRKVLEEVGLLDEDMFAYYEETDLCARIKKAGYRIYYTPKAVVWHNVPKKRKRPSRYITYYMHRNRVIYCYKNYGHKNIFLALDLLFLFNVFALYEFIRVPGSIRFIREVLRARVDSIRYCQG